MLPTATKWSCSDYASFTCTRLYQFWYFWLQLLYADSQYWLFKKKKSKKKKKLQNCVTRVRNDGFYMLVINITFFNSIQSIDNRALTFQVTMCKFGPRTVVVKSIRNFKKWIHYLFFSDLKMITCSRSCIKFEHCCGPVKLWSQNIFPLRNSATNCSI